MSIVEALFTLPPLYATEHIDTDDKTIGVRMTATWTSAEWLLCEFDPETRVAFGWCDLGVGCPEWGYVSADELADLDVDLGSGFHSVAVLDRAFQPTSFGSIDRRYPSI